MNLASSPTPESVAIGSGRLADFVIIGAMKAGTTTLFEYLRRHPEVFMANPKETNYFSIEEVLNRGEGWYRELFAGAKEDQVCGEASPSYTRYPRFPSTPSRMAKLLPDAKLIYLMRHPVDRFYSNYVFDRSYGFREPMEKTLTERPYVLETSRYINQIRNYLEVYPRESFHFVLLDDLQADPRGELARLAQFLGIASFAESDEDEQHANPRGKQHAIRQGNRLLRAMRRTPGVRSITKAMPPSVRTAGRDLLTKWLPNGPIGRWLSRRHSASVAPMTNDFRYELHRLLDPSTRELETFLGRDLLHWRLPANADP